MSEISLEHLGFTKEELQDRIIDRICEKMLTTITTDDEETEFTTSTPFKAKLQTAIQKQIDDSINRLAEKYVLPNVAAYIENLSLQETTRWGESKGQKITFIEYLVQRAEVYMQEQVNYEGKNQKECGGYSFNGTQTRLAHMMHKHLHYSIETALQAAVKDANSKIVEGIQETAKIKLGEISKALKVEVRSK